MRRCFSILASGFLAGTVSSVCCSAAEFSNFYSEADDYDAVRTGEELVESVLACKRDEYGLLRIRLEDDVTLESDLALPSGTILDLSGHTIKLYSGASVVVGEKVLKGEDVQYDDDAFVEISNGQIVGLSSLDGADGKVSGKAEEANGEDGSSSERAVVCVFSGELKVKDLKISGGKGGAGGNAAYSKISHMPGSSLGGGGNGGNGGNGSDVFYAEVGHGVVTVKGGCEFFPGAGGEAGKGSGPNPGYWLWSGVGGHDGEKGSDGSLINDVGSLARVT